MRWSTVTIVSLAASSASAADSFSFGALKDKLASYIPSSVQHPIDTASAKSASKHVVALTADNWKTTLSPHPSPGKAPLAPEEWWVLFSGGNSSCYGRCEKAEKSFNESSGLLQASSKRPHFAMVNCDSQALLCTTVGASVPSLWQVLVPALIGKPTSIRIKELNYTTVSASEIMSIHTTKSWNQVPVYEGWMHPFDSQLAKLGLNVPLGYVLWGFSVVPSWMFMIAVSFLSRNFVSRRAAPPRPRAAGPAPVAVPAAAT